MKRATLKDIPTPRPKDGLTMMIDLVVDLARTVGRLQRPNHWDYHTRYNSILWHQRRAFARKFGRKPLPEEPVFFNPRTEIPTPYDRAYLRRRMARRMSANGVPPLLVMTFLRTEFLLLPVHGEVPPEPKQ